MRTLVVGDIHSALKALEQVLRKVEPTKTDRFIFLGDYVDGWSDAAQTVSFLIDFAKDHQCIFIRGNHDYLMYMYLKHNDINPLWLAHGGKESKESYDRLSHKERQRHIKFYKNLTNYYVDKKNRLFVHAGFTHIAGPHHEFYKNLVFWDRTLWETARALDTNISEENVRYPQRLKNFREIYIGHTPVTRMGALQPLNFANVWNVDTGAAFKGPLSIIDVDTKEIWQSEPAFQLYPNEIGRN